MSEKPVVLVVFITNYLYRDTGFTNSLIRWAKKSLHTSNLECRTMLAPTLSGQLLSDTNLKAVILVTDSRFVDQVTSMLAQVNPECKCYYVISEQVGIEKCRKEFPPKALPLAYSVEYKFKKPTNKRKKVPA